jgi:hypothetical protein
MMFVALLFLWGTLHSINYSRPSYFCDVDLATSFVIQCWAQVVAINAIRVPRGRLVWFFMCNDAGSRGRHGDPVEFIMSIELGMGGHAWVNP